MGYSESKIWTPLFRGEGEVSIFEFEDNHSLRGMVRELTTISAGNQKVRVVMSVLSSLLSLSSPSHQKIVSCVICWR
jgi:hypothetical protein